MADVDGPSLKSAPDGLTNRLDPARPDKLKARGRPRSHTASPATTDAPDELTCAVCGQDHPFELPKELLTAALEHKLVVFAGAGISTESRLSMGPTFADELRAELGKDADSLDFPALMSAYQRRFGRPRLLQQIRARLDYIKGFPQLQAAVVRFHRELATAYFLDEIVTTNWDTYFEDFAAATPIVVPGDYAFWDIAGRKVFKLHGSMHNLSSLVATKKEYARCYRRLQRGTIGSTFKHLLATKRVVFIGYSFGDSDLSRILAFMRRELGDVLPRSFLVTPHGYSGKDFPADRVIKTDGTFFIRTMKEAAVDIGVMHPDSVYDRVERLAERVSKARQRSARAFRVDKYPAAIYTWAYQDGLLHAFGRILALRSSGQYSNTHSHRVQTYGLALTGAIRKRQYFDAAYILGYRYGLMALEIDDETAELLPLYHVWGSDGDLIEYADFSRELKRAVQLHKGATAKALRMVKDSAGLVPVHTHFLDVEGLAAAASPRHRSKAAVGG